MTGGLRGEGDLAGGGLEEDVLDVILAGQLVQLGVRSLGRRGRGRRLVAGLVALAWRVLDVPGAAGGRQEGGDSEDEANGQRLSGHWAIVTTRPAPFGAGTRPATQHSA